CPMSLSSNNIFEFEGFRLDLAEKNLTRDGDAIPVTPKVFETLKIFVENAGRLIEKDELMEKLWHERFVEESNLTFNIKMVRKALGDDASKPRFIETVPKRGYRFIAEVQRVESDDDQKAMGLVAVSSSHHLHISHPPASAPTSPSAQKVVALAEWRHEVDAKLPEDTNGDVIKFELAGTRRADKFRSTKYLAVVVAGVILSALGLGYSFFHTPTGSGSVESVAVLPFVNATGDTNTEYLSEGLSDSIINGLSRLPNLKVISLNSVLRYRGKEINPQTVGGELNVNAVVMGRLTQQGDELTISAELIDVRDNRRLWGGQYRRKLSDILAVQGEIAREISEGLRPRLTGEQKNLLAKRHTDNNDAFLFYSMGKYSGRQNTREGFEKAIESFDHAVEIDPEYALAYAAIADTYQFMMSRGFLAPKEYAPKVELAALKALQIDDSLAEAHAALGAHRLINFDWVGAEIEIKRALDLDPNSAYANSVYAHLMLGLGRTGESLSLTIRARDLESMPSRGEDAFAYYMARQYDKAIELYLKTLEKNPDNAHAQILLGEAYVAKGMPADGVAAMEKGLAIDKTLAKTPERWDRYPLMAYAYAAAGRRDDALKILDDQLRLANERYLSPYNFAIIYTALGDKDKAFEKLSECIDERIMIIYHLKTRPVFDSLRSDPRYVELLSKMNLTP
ncbi:MAG: winged helix-turn-helix domain-containing protein, partial [Acidobacteriota bacterium]